MEVVVFEQMLQAGAEFGKVQGRQKGWHLRGAVLSRSLERWPSVAQFR